MATTRTDGTDASKNVADQMRAEKRRRKNQPKPATVISGEQTVQGSSAQGGPNPNGEGLPVRQAAVEASEADEAVEGATEATEGDSGAGALEEELAEAVAEEIERPSGTFGGKIEWLAFRLANGYTAYDLVDLGRNALRDLDDR